MKNQEVFDTVVAHLRAQGCKAIVDGACKLRGPNGTKCAAGCLIPDSDYDPDWDNKPLLGFQYVFAKVEDSDFVDKLVVIHDYKEVYAWENQFQKLAERYGLEYENISNE